MRSGTSFFDLTIYRKTVNRFWPLWVVNLVLWIFLLPMNGLMQLEPDRTLLRFSLNVGDRATDFGIIFALLFGLVVAMAVCSHMYNNRSANFMGSLPCRREGQFLSTYAAGLTILIGPNLAVFVLTLVVELVGWAVVWSPLLFWLGALCAMEFFFFTFAVCLGQFTGHILALPVYYGIFNAIVVAVYGLLRYVLDVYYFGFDGLSSAGENLVMWCTPVAMLCQMDIDATSVGSAILTDIEGLWIAGVYAIVAVVLAVCALLLYRRRHLETAGDIVAVKVMRPVFKYGVAICAGLFFGFLMDQMFGLGELGMMIAIVIWGIVGYFVAQMLLEKSVRVFKKWKGAAAVTVVFLLLFAVIAFDLTGFERRVPSVSNVASAEIRGLHSGLYYDTGADLGSVLLTDPADIEAVVALHQGIVDQGEQGEYGYYYDEYGNYLDRFISFRVTYTLKNGSVMSRRYSVVMGEALLAKAQALRDRDNVRYQAYNLDDIAAWVEDGYRLNTASYYLEYEAGQSYETLVSGAQLDRLWAAVMEDFEAGRIGVHTVGGEAKITDDFSYDRLSFQWSKRVEDGARYQYIEFLVLPQSSATWEVLEELTAPGQTDQADRNDDPLARG